MKAKLSRLNAKIKEREQTIRELKAEGNDERGLIVFQELEKLKARKSLINKYKRFK